MNKSPVFAMAQVGAGVTLLLLALAIGANPALAGNTATLPAGAFLLDGNRLWTRTETRWSDGRTAQPLIDGIVRYEPGGGLQGTITAKPFVSYRFVSTQLFYGLTDHLTLAVAAPLITASVIEPRLGWTPGQYQSTLGRPYSETDFWQWAQSMGQPKPGDFRGNDGVLADLVLGARYRLPPLPGLRDWGIDSAVAVQGALPTGQRPDPEELVAAGTTVWDLHNYGDAEVHLALERGWRWDGVARINLGVDVYYSWLRERSYQTPRGVRNPLLLTFAPYVGESYRINPGDMAGVTGLLELVPWIGPTRGSWIAGGKLENAAKFPPLLTLSAAHTYAHVNSSDWTSESRLWDWEREEDWQPGDKNTVKLGADLSLLRIGLPLQFYAGYRNQEWIPGRNTRATNVTSVGARLLLKFW